jgi:hypothetical protein
VAQLPLKSAGKLLCLIETPLALPRGVQWHRNEQNIAGVAQLLFPTPNRSQKPPKAETEAFSAPEFQQENGSPKRACVQAEVAGQVECQFFAPALTAERWR